MLILLYLHFYRLHHAATGLKPVSRILIDMFGPQTLRTMIGIAVAGHFPAAMFADKVFYSLCEFLWHLSWLISLILVGALGFEPRVT